MDASSVVISRVVYSSDQASGPELARVGPLGVTEGSKQTLQAIMISMATVVILLAALLTTTVLRGRRTSKSRS